MSRSTLVHRYSLGLDNLDTSNPPFHLGGVVGSTSLPEAVCLRRQGLSRLVGFIALTEWLVSCPLLPRLDERMCRLKTDMDGFLRGEQTSREEEEEEE